MAGLIKSVRPVGLPCRPMKLRLLEEAHISSPSSLSGFMARHMEHPASRHSAPAVLKILSRPSCSACFLICWEPGTTSILTEGCTFLPAMIFAASRMSEIRELVQDPTNATLMGMFWMGVPGVNFI